MKSPFGPLRVCSHPHMRIAPIRAVPEINFASMARSMFCSSCGSACHSNTSLKFVQMLFGMKPVFQFVVLVFFFASCGSNNSSESNLDDRERELIRREAKIEAQEELNAQKQDASEANLNAASETDEKRPERVQEEKAPSMNYFARVRGAIHSPPSDSSTIVMFAICRLGISPSCAMRYLHDMDIFSARMKMSSGISIINRGIDLFLMRWNYPILKRPISTLSNRWSKAQDNENLHATIILPDFCLHRSMSITRRQSSS